MQNNFRNFDRISGELNAVSRNLMIQFVEEILVIDIGIICER